MQYRYHEWTDKILSKRTAESIGASTLIGLKTGFNDLNLTTASRDQPYKLSIGHKIHPSNSINDWLHLDRAQQKSLVSIGCVITPDCIVTTETEAINFNLDWDGTIKKTYVLTASHIYTEIPESSATLQGGSPTNYTLVDLTDTINGLPMSHEEFINGYLYTGEAGNLMDLINSVNSGLLPYNTTIMSMVILEPGDIITQIPIYNNKIPLIKELTVTDFNDLLKSLADVRKAMSDLKTELEGSMTDLENRVQVALDTAIENVNQTLTQMVEQINQALSNLRTEINETIDELESQVNVNIGKVQTELDKSNADISKLLEHSKLYSYYNKYNNRNWGSMGSASVSFHTVTSLRSSSGRIMVSVALNGWGWSTNPGPPNNVSWEEQYNNNQNGNYINQYIPGVLTSGFSAPSISTIPLYSVETGNRRGTLTLNYPSSGSLDCDKFTISIDVSGLMSDFGAGDKKALLQGEYTWSAVSD